VVIEGSALVQKGKVPEIAITLSADIVVKAAWIDLTNLGPNESGSLAWTTRAAAASSTAT
jgi:hypothetical protein